MDLQTEIGRIASEILGRPVDPDTSFFELGATSLQAVTLVDRLKSELDLRIPIFAIVDHPSVSALARYASDPPAYDDDLEDAEEGLL